ncbi:MAG: hypothetical protein J0H29_21040 [Sphingobacteriales bacterium]|nr:hypothetical protein [Sphingobacteriales bacterium]OJY86367.1 MAG: hypothetical protein BGP14_20545 [Sphingobacteriales bacterium 44-15]
MTTPYRGFRIQADKLDNGFTAIALRDKNGNLIKAETVKEILPEAVFATKCYIDLLLRPEESLVIA